MDEGAKIKLMIGKPESETEEGFDHDKHMADMITFAKQAKDLIGAGKSNEALAILDKMLSEEKTEEKVEAEGEEDGETFEEKIKKYV